MNYSHTKYQALLPHSPELLRNGKLFGGFIRPSVPECMELLLSFMGGVSLSISWMLRSEWLECAISETPPVWNK